MYFCRTVQTEQPRSPATWAISNGSPRDSAKLQFAIRCVSVRSIATQFSGGSRENRQQTEGLKGKILFFKISETGKGRDVGVWYFQSASGKGSLRREMRGWPFPCAFHRSDYFRPQAWAQSIASRDISKAGDIVGSDNNVECKYTPAGRAMLRAELRFQLP